MVRLLHFPVRRAMPLAFASPAERMFAPFDHLGVEAVLLGADGVAVRVSRKAAEPSESLDVTIPGVRPGDDVPAACARLTRGAAGLAQALEAAVDSVRRGADFEVIRTPLAGESAESASPTPAGLGWAALAAPLGDVRHVLIALIPQPPPSPALVRFGTEQLAAFSTDVVARYSIGGVCLQISASCEAVYGYTAAELRAMDSWTVLHPDDAPWLRCITRAVALGVPIGPVVYRRRHKAGHWIWVEAQTTPIRDPATAVVVEFLVVVRDVTTRREAEARLGALSARYSSLLERMVEAAFVVDLSADRIVEANPSFLRMTGRSADDIGMIDPGASLMASARLWVQVRDELESTGRLQAIAVVWRGVERRSLDVELTGALLPDPSRKLGFFLARSLSREREAERALAKTSRSHEAFAQITRVVSRGGSLEEVVGVAADALHATLDTCLVSVWLASEATSGNQPAVAEQAGATRPEAEAAPLDSDAPEVPLASGPSDVPSQAEGGASALPRASGLVVERRTDVCANRGDAALWLSGPGVRARETVRSSGQSTILTIDATDGTGSSGDAELDEGREGAGTRRPKSAAIIPVRSGEERLGTLTLMTCGRPYSAADTVFAEGIAAMIGATVALRRAERALRISEERYAATARGSNVGLWDYDVLAETVHVSGRFAEIAGIGADETTLRIGEFFDTAHPDDRALLRNSFCEHGDADPRPFSIEVRIALPDACRWGLYKGMAVRGRHGRLVRIAGSLTDVTRKKEQEAELVHGALHDRLTGLPNRQLALDRIGHALQRARRTGECNFALLYLDLDGFKLVNDSLGHVIGDRFLCDVAARLAGTVRSSDTLARLGGDEFVVLLESVWTIDRVVRAAKRYADALRPPFELDGREYFIGASIGIAMATPAYAHAEELLRDADIAMYRAKANRGGGPAVFDEKMHARMLARLQTQTDLRGAEERGELFLLFQPVVDLDTRRMVSTEALVRWKHPSRGLIPPAEFIGIAEESGLIVPIGAWVIDDACRTAAAWGRSHPGGSSISVAVNVAPRQFTERSLIERVERAVEIHQIPRHRLAIEVTEGSLMEKTGASEEQLRALSQAGFRILVDDFGTAYSSLAYLNRFPVNALKIDRSFVQGIEADPSKANVAGTIVALARALSLDVIAEGVETEAQRDFLLSIGCQKAQGYLFSKPVPADEIPRLIGRVLPASGG